MEILSLSRNKQFIPIVAKWTYCEFVKGIRDNLSQKQIEGILNLFKDDEIPMTLIAVENNICIGSVSLLKNDLKRLEFTPWLGSLYVDEHFRNKGVGELLVNSVINKTRSLGYEYLYLRTEFASDYYKRLGWESLLITMDDIWQRTEVFQYKL